MPHATPLIATIVGGIVLAFILGALAFRLRLSPLIGYLLAGVVVGPFTPGYVADQDLANELAELGVILLMFGVGLHFSLKDLLAVRKIAIPGALVQISVAVVLGLALAWSLGWSFGSGIVFGLALSVASTVVLLRALQERRILDTERGRIAVGWLIVEDLVMVLTLVLLPALAHGGSTPSSIGLTLLITIGKVAAFVAFMLIVGRRLVPWLLHAIAHSGSRELFRLAVLAVALGVAFGAATLFDVSFALGAFFAGMILAESQLSQRAAEETLPLRDAFAVLFFVSVGMLFDPSIVVDEPLQLFATLAIILVGKSVAAFMIVRTFGHSSKTALTIAASLAQIGEFSFILATLGSTLGLLDQDARSLILAGAIISIMLNPLLFHLIDRFGRKDITESDVEDQVSVAAPPPPTIPGHVVIVGYGRIGSRIGEALLAAGERVTILETQADRAGLPSDDARTKIVIGNAAAPDILRQADLGGARLLLIASPPSYESGQIIEQARGINPALPIFVRAQSDEEVEYFAGKGASDSVVGDYEIARRMIGHALKRATA